MDALRVLHLRDNVEESLTHVWPMQWHTVVRRLTSRYPSQTRLEPIHRSRGMQSLIDSGSFPTFKQRFGVHVKVRTWVKHLAPCCRKFTAPNLVSSTALFYLLAFIFQHFGVIFVFIHQLFCSRYGFDVVETHGDTTVSRGWLVGRRSYRFLLMTRR